MSDLPAITGREAVSAFEKAEFVLVRISKSSHHIMKKAGHRYLLSVPVHGKKILKPGTLRKLIKDSGLTVEQFVEFLK
ncbi:type II toxin-antitoxin system HicA family toxin [Bythopirellula goksoeyrii]|uniref:YcfA-like protein n=1 Tax=Bythopirellula goksoeyrii TaxID=1400387 RepID=A0A5B9QER3_9BACT|nr:type II toxin-antitoxin system HicA family toxin [Bythopirellula goksoeyrii]QEG35396.1 YcfA-like protein [Bythopirellula goksoeyrii]